MRERGNLSEIVLAPGRQLDHPYTLDDRVRVPSGCADGQGFPLQGAGLVSALCAHRVRGLRNRLQLRSSTTTRATSTVYRHRPRENLDVNKYWMCDEGMLDYARIHEDRVLEARVGRKKAAYETALDKAAGVLKNADPDATAVVLSAQHSNEDNFALLDAGARLHGRRHLFCRARRRARATTSCGTPTRTRTPPA